MGDFGLYVWEGGGGGVSSTNEFHYLIEFKYLRSIL